MGKVQNMDPLSWNRFMYSLFLLVLKLVVIKDCRPDCMSRAGPVSRTASVCREDFLPGITRGEPAWLLADAMNQGRTERA